MMLLTKLYTLIPELIKFIDSDDFSFANPSQTYPAEVVDCLRIWLKLQNKEQEATMPAACLQLALLLSFMANTPLNKTPSVIENAVTDPNTVQVLLTAIFWVAARGDFGGVKEFCAHPKIDINQRDQDGSTPLHHAAWSGKPEIVEFLLNRPDINLTPVDYHGDTPLSTALKQIKGGHTVTGSAQELKKGWIKIVALLKNKIITQFCNAAMGAKPEDLNSLLAQPLPMNQNEVCNYLLNLTGTEFDNSKKLELLKRSIEQSEMGAPTNALSMFMHIDSQAITRIKAGVSCLELIMFGLTSQPVSKTDNSRFSLWVWGRRASATVHPSPHPLNLPPKLSFRRDT